MIIKELFQYLNTDFVNKNLMGVGKKDHERVKICFLAMKSKLIIIL